MNSGGACALSLDSVSKVYGSGDGAVTALNGVTVEVRRGTFTAVMGPSGSGKSTFLHCAAGLDKPSSGRVLLGDTELSRMREKALTELRRTRIGFVFQAYNLLPSLNVLQNITLPLRLAGKKPDPQWLREIVEGVGIAKRLEHRPSELSGGQQQRVAIARALVTRPEVVLADEPTGALDTRTAKQVLDLLRSIVDGMGQTVLMVTHDPVAASAAHSVLFLADGKLAGHLPAPTPERVAERMTHLGEW
ncbi:MULTISPECIES: ABC transporter ATP-binding protein [Amycolatopsis]|uniref:ABC transporter ATP-binding protein n=1 Tax=unclassified Amycolatopsis TaxID=2618356 RepID=UPI00093C19C1|nr:ABC transporter ATP-binding protein [Amycolatopsis sp. CB00013]OKK01083.1 ABC transporter [Amycolatopsis sp. CB00013]